MAYTDIDICNLALQNVGVAAKIAALNETSKEGRLCLAQLALSRDQLLAEPRRDWTFARMRSVLAESADPVRSGYAYVYDMPATVLTPRRIWNGFWEYRPEDEIPYRVELNVAGTAFVVLTDMAPDAGVAPELFSTKAITSPTLFPPFFIGALAWDLAAKLVMPEIISADMQEKAAKKAEIMLLRAILADVKSEKRGPSPKDSFTASRGRFGTGSR